MDNASARNMWGDYLDAHLEFAFVEAPKVLHFSDNEQDADHSVDLVLKNLKNAASFSLLGLQHRKEPLPKVGAFMILTDWNGKAKCIVRTTAVKLKPFFSITKEYVQMDGLGDLFQIDPNIALFVGLHRTLYKIQTANTVHHGREFAIVILFTTNCPCNTQIDVGHRIKNSFRVSWRQFSTSQR